MRGEDGQVGWIVVLAVLGAPERRRLRRRRRRAVEGEPLPAPVTTGRATIIETERPYADAEAARVALPGTGEEDAERAVAVLDRLLHAHRVVAADPTVPLAGLDRAIAVRVGWTEGDAAAEGRLIEGFELPLAGEGARRPARRAGALRPQEHLAAVLARRTPLLTAESLALRAREDLDADRMRDAALQLGPALDAALAEVGREPRGEELTRRLEELRGLRDGVHARARAVLAGEVPDPEPLAHDLGRLEALLRARAAGLG